MSQQRVRHILGISGGKDSTALAVLMQQQHPELEIEYFFCDTHKELPETYTYLDRIEARLGIKIHKLSAKRGFDHWLETHGGLLPSPQMRWCTNMMKIKPLEAFIGDDEAISYIGIRADENREGYISTKPNIKPVFPFKEQGLVKADILKLLEDSGIGQDGRTYTWTEGETLLELLNRKEEIIANHEKSVQRAKEREQVQNQPLSQVLDSVFENKSFAFANRLESILDEEDEETPCTICHL